MVARMKQMDELENEGRVVLRARSDWQRFQANRLMYGRFWDWHTLEGPCARKHEGRYYCFYSGGRWETENYGVDYGIADNVLGPTRMPEMSPALGLAHCAEPFAGSGS